MEMKIKSSVEALSREFEEKKHYSQTSLEDTSVRNMLLKAVYLTSASLAVRSNVIEELQNFMNYEIRELK